jgi:hypothetical protein
VRKTSIPSTRILHHGSDWPRVTYPRPKQRKAPSEKSQEEAAVVTKPSKFKISRRQHAKRKAVDYFINLMTNKATKGFSLNDLLEKGYKATNCAKDALKRLIHTLRLHKFFERRDATSRYVIAEQYRGQEPKSLIEIAYRVVAA